MAGLASRTFILVVAATFALFTGTGAVIPVLPRYVAGPLGGGGVAIGFAVGAFSLATLASRPWAGRLGEVRGRRYLMAGGGLLVTLAVGGLALGGGLPAVLALRGLQGIGQGAFYVGAAVAATDLVPPARRGEAVSYFSAALYAGLALGPLVGEAALAAGGYRTVWLVAGALCAVGTAFGLSLSEPARPRAARAGRPPLFHRGSILPGTAFGLATFGFAAFITFGALYATHLGLSGAGGVFAVYAGITLVGRVAAARLPERVGLARTIRVSMAGLALGMAVLAFWPTTAGLWTGVVVFAVANTFMFPALMALSLARAAESERAAVVGTVVAFFDVAQGLGAITLGPLFSMVGYAGPFAAGAIGSVAALFVLSTYLRQAVPSEVVALSVARGPETAIASY